MSAWDTSIGVRQFLLLSSKQAATNRAFWLVMVTQSFSSNLACVLLLCLTVNAGSEAASNCSSDHRSLYDYWDKTLAGKVPFKYSKYKPSVFLMVNVATYWGFTKVQYPALNALAARYNHSVCPLRVFGVPCNQFHYQEPGLGEEIPNGLKYVRPGNGFVPMFPLLEKRDVNGLNESNVYTWLKSLCPNPTTFIMDRSDILYSPVRTTDITWNFEKILIDHKGKPKKRFTPDVNPHDLEEDIKNMIEVCKKQDRKGQVKV